MYVSMAVLYKLFHNTKIFFNKKVKSKNLEQKKNV